MYKKSIKCFYHIFKNANRILSEKQKSFERKGIKIFLRKKETGNKNMVTSDINFLLKLKKEKTPV